LIINKEGGWGEYKKIQFKHVKVISSNIIIKGTWTRLAQSV